ncbi:MAG: LytR/AlgR family response regulator transcription factor [Verrucomicrobium sp.]
MIRALIVDDENPARREMRRLLAAHEDVLVLGEAASASEALQLATDLKPEVIFLDIQMPERTGLEAATALLGNGCEVVFVTAYDEHALRAFDLAVFDYLLKPVEPERLARTLDRLRGNGAGDRVSGQVLREDDRIFLKGSDGHWFTPLSSIRLLQSEGNCTRVYFDEDSPVISRSLATLEERLPPQMFFRANRAQMINVRWIETTEEWFSHSLKVMLKDGTSVELSRRQSRVFRETFGL